MPDSTRFAELCVPHHGTATSAALGYLFVFIFAGVAAYNLVFIQYVPIVATIASVLWLLLISWVVVVNIRDEGGIRQYIINRLGIFSRQQFVRATPEHDAETISFGYLMFGRFLSYRIVDVNAISSIDWSSGQATAMAGRDMNDWHVELTKTGKSRIKRLRGLSRPQYHLRVGDDTRVMSGQLSRDIQS